MHEMGIVQSIIDIVEQEMERHGVDKLKKIHLSVGKMTAIVPEQMTFCFGVLTEDGKLAGAELEIRIVPITYHCRDCSAEFVSKGISERCARCGGENIEMISGRELKIESIEVAD